ncbi:synaptonemal complex protein 3-like isoform X1 [Mesocricetus auratus]|uniref:Synaptonemal complex protein 3-like isoform X1 n=1 Tax=Mesocricetus auratus TaxID=10036 RepID=A0ABM2XFS8_MESAU|nr:synaptonemal complex protein 3-like isoform X1 [Mesocricetus auratus]
MAVPKDEYLVLFDFDDEEDDPSVSEKALPEVLTEKNPVFKKDKRKWPPAEADEDMGDEIHTMLDKFGDEINSSLLKKRRRVHMFSKTISEESSNKMKQVWKTKEEQMLQVNNKYYQQFMDLFNQWDLEKQKYEKQQKNLMKIFQQQQMMLRNCKIKQNQRVKLILQKVTQYIEILKNMEGKNNNVHTASFIELKKEIAEYQKKYMIETQQQEIANIRKSLQSILF